MITEVSLDYNNKEFWVEIFNPSCNDLTLNSFRLSGIRSLNILPPKIRIKNGIKIESGDYLILCSDLVKFKSRYDHKIAVIEVQDLSEISKNGFLAINNLGPTENAANVVQFGNKNKQTFSQENSYNIEILHSLKECIFFSRYIQPNGQVSSWSRSVPKPGRMEVKK